MEKSFLLRASVFLVLILFLFFPILHLLFYISLEPISWDPIIIDVLKGAGLQSLLSTLLTVILALVGAFGLIGLSQKVSPNKRVFLQTFIMLPSFLPPLVVVILGTQALGTYFTGLWGVVFFHVLMNVGVVGLLLEHYIVKSSEGYSQLCAVEGVSSFRFITKGLLPGIKNEIQLICSFLFILYFLSFSIPLLVGGIQYGGIEVFIYEKIFLFGNWSEAIQYSIGFIVLLFLLSFVSSKKLLSQKVRLETVYGLKLYSNIYLSIVLFLPIFFLGIGLVTSLGHLPRSLMNFEWSYARGTMLTGLLTGCCIVIVLSLMGYAFVREELSKSTFSLVSPSWAVVGFSLFLYGSNAAHWGFVKVAIALTILYVPYLFRLSFLSSLRDIKSQVDIAVISGASWNKIFFVIIWPQILPMICFLGGLGALWACGDFAISGMLLGDEMTMALQMKSLFMNYRLEQALLLLIPLVSISAIIYLIFQGLSYVCRRSFLS